MSGKTEELIKLFVLKFFENFVLKLFSAVQTISFISLNSYQCIHLEKTVQKLIKKIPAIKHTCHSIFLLTFTQYIHIQFHFPHTMLYLQLGVLELLQENLQVDTPFDTCRPREKHDHSSLKRSFRIRSPQC